MTIERGSQTSETPLIFWAKGVQVPDIAIIDDAEERGPILITGFCSDLRERRCFGWNRKVRYMTFLPASSTGVASSSIRNEPKKRKMPIGPIDTETEKHASIDLRSATCTRRVKKKTAETSENCIVFCSAVRFDVTRSVRWLYRGTFKSSNFLNVGSD